MAISVQQLNDESIILFSFEEAVDEQQVVSAYYESLDLAMTLSGPVYRVFDLTQADTASADIIAMIGNVAKDVAGAAVIPQLAAVFVGQTLKAGGIAPGFAFQHDALAYVRQQTSDHVIA